MSAKLILLTCVSESGEKAETLVNPDHIVMVRSFTAEGMPEVQSIVVLNLLSGTMEERAVHPETLFVKETALQIQVKIA